MTAAKSAEERRYSMVTPCKACPFRLDVEPYLRAERAQEIADSIAGGGEFPCHRTTESSEDGEGNETLVDGARSMLCAGAMATQVASGFPNQMLRIAGSMGLIDLEKLRRSRHLVSRSLGAWALRFRDDVQYYVDEDGDRYPFENCGAVASNDCQDPAGYQGMGANPEPGTLDPTDPKVCCESCGKPICPACRSERWSEPSGRVCAICYDPANYDADDAPPERDDDYDYE